MGYITKEGYEGGELHCTAEVIIRTWLAFADSSSHSLWTLVKL